ncbi:MAG TPA: matrixin family metalloprotease [Acidimicrobiales bacterium]|nr:matrixin family metalloprotease [Acidimicrobiales bacterium]
MAPIDPTTSYAQHPLVPPMRNGAVRSVQADPGGWLRLIQANAAQAAPAPAPVEVTSRPKVIYVDEYVDDDTDTDFDDVVVDDDDIENDHDADVTPTPDPLAGLFMFVGPGGRIGTWPYNNGEPIAIGINVADCGDPDAVPRVRAVTKRIANISGFNLAFIGPVTQTSPTDDVPIVVRYSDDAPSNGPHRVLGTTEPRGFTRDDGQTIITSATVTLFNDATRPTGTGPGSWGTLTLHEMAHALGLAHSDDANGLMFPTVTGAVDFSPIERRAFAVLLAAHRGLHDTLATATPSEILGRYFWTPPPGHPCRAHGCDACPACRGWPVTQTCCGSSTGATATATRAIPTTFDEWVDVVADTAATADAPASKWFPAQPPVTAAPAEPEPIVVVRRHVRRATPKTSSPAATPRPSATKPASAPPTPATQKPATPDTTRTPAPVAAAGKPKALNPPSPEPDWLTAIRTKSNTPINRKEKDNT